MNAARTTYCLQTTSVAETHAFGQRLGEIFVQTNTRPLVVALSGNLGAGKTALTQGIAAGLGISARVTSPTYIFVNEYPTPTGQTMVHIDSYRLGEAPDEAALEAFTFGLEEILEREETIVIIEWADRVADLLPVDHLHIALTYTDDQPDRREICCTAYGPVSSAVILSTAKNENENAPVTGVHNSHL
jgi:tRNA threonylcarbamoyladenosine biosynthesis protein TsaE